MNQCCQVEKEHCKGNHAKHVFQGSPIWMIESPFLEVDRVTFFSTLVIEVPLVVVEPRSRSKVSCVVDIVAPLGVVEVVQVEVVPCVNVVVALLHVAPSKKRDSSKLIVEESGNYFAHGC